MSKHFPPRVDPMAPTRVREPFHRPDWVYEAKYVAPLAPDEQLVRLRAREPVPEARVAESRLNLDEGGPPAPADGDGRGEFRVGQ